MRVVTPKDASYDQSRRMVNKRFDEHPAAILYCYNADDVQEAVAMAISENKKLRVRSTGHSYEAFSMGGSNVFVIDVSGMNAITVDTKNQSANIESGSQLYYDVYLTLWSEGRFVIPGGSCPTVGITGLMAGGGFSFSGRKFGLTCDSVTGFSIVTADGKLLKVDSQTSPDLFWACRGGGNGNFGVITDLSFKLYPADDVAIYRISWAFDEMLPEIANAWADMVSNTSSDFTPFLKFSVDANVGPVLSSFGQYYGTQKELQDIVNQYFGKFKYISLTFDTLSNIDAVRRWGGVKMEGIKNHEPQHMIHPVYFGDKKPIRPGFIFDDDANFFKVASIMLYRFFNADELAYLLKTIKKAKPGIFISLDGIKNGFSSTLPDDYSAYAHRQAVASVQIYYTWTDPRQAVEFTQLIKEIRDILKDAGNGGAYVNYPDALLMDNYPEAYYKQHYLRLQTIKKQYDPNNIFTYSQSIKPAN